MLTVLDRDSMAGLSGHSHDNVSILQIFEEILVIFQSKAFFLLIESIKLLFLVMHAGLQVRQTSPLNNPYPNTSTPDNT